MPNYIKKLFLTCFIMLAGMMITQTECHAQFNFCQDTLLINPFFPCVQEYEPVCACNGVTYRNECFARNKDGIIGQINSGPCGLFDIDLVPIPPVNNQMSLGIYLNEPVNVEYFIIDVYGVTVFKKTLRSVQYLQREYIDTTNYERGIYLLVVVVKNKFQLKKFTVIN